MPRRRSDAAWIGLDGAPALTNGRIEAYLDSCQDVHPRLGDNAVAGRRLVAMTTGEDKKTVYIETSVVSYLTARPTSNLVAAAWQKTTADWWDVHRSRFDLCTSALTIEEAGRGNPQAAERRIQALAGIVTLPITEAAVKLATALLQGRALPTSAQNDALHIGVAAANGVDYILTWNFRHLANAETRHIIRTVCSGQGFTSPEICSPSELIGGFENV